MTEHTNEPFAASVHVDRDMCQTAATCLAWNIYELDDESKAILLTSNGSNSDEPSNPLTQFPEGSVRLEDLLNDSGHSIEEMRELVMESAQACPFNAIIVKDAQGNVIWPLS